MKDFTVVLLRPAYLNEVTEEVYGKDIYVASVKAANTTDALVVAQFEVFEADKKDKLKAKSPTDYQLSVMFEGHPKIALFGWQA
jgi:hypothetical protein